MLPEDVAAHRAPGALPEPPRLKALKGGSPPPPRRAALPRIPAPRGHDSGLRRIPFTQHCRLEARGSSRDGLLANVSVLGVYVSFEPVPAVGDAFHVSFRLPSEEAPISVDAVVTWRNPKEDHKVRELLPGCGMRFLGLERRDRERIRAFVRSRSASGSRAMLG